MTKRDTFDVVVVGGGVAGAAIAARLAEAGTSVLVLERDLAYTDRVRGEGMVPWGYEAAGELGLADVIRSAPGASFMTRLVAYDELQTVEQSRARSVDLANVLPGVPGLLAVGHPELRAGLIDEAVRRGAVVVRGVAEIGVEPGQAPAVSWTCDGVPHRASCRLAIAADGKESVVRRSLGIELETTIPTMMLTGMLVDDGGAWDRAEVTIGVHGENQLYVFPRAGALRLYAGRLVGADTLSGADRARQMLDCFRVDSLPHADALAGATPIGPCATFAMTDTWTGTPYAEGVVLVGDAAGWSNPVTG
jgi:2-polyprenyl-6-methoxyphenol hydroxylase-like FAD-dependent oxidoreductase